MNLETSNWIKCQCLPVREVITSFTRGIGGWLIFSAKASQRRRPGAKSGLNTTSILTVGVHKILRQSCDC